MIDQNENISIDEGRIREEGREGERQEGEKKKREREK